MIFYCALALGLATGIYAVTGGRGTGRPGRIRAAAAPGDSAAHRLLRHSPRRVHCAGGVHAGPELHVPELVFANEIYPALRHRACEERCRC